MQSKIKSVKFNQSIMQWWLFLTLFFQVSFTHFDFGHLFLSIFILFKLFLKKEEIM
jgi:hypothetical protein